MGVTVLALSVVHCTEAIAAATGSEPVLAALMAIGIDAGMVMAELGEVAAPGNADVRLWSRRIVWTSVVTSMLLNAYGFTMHAGSAVQMVGGVTLGVMIPALVLMMGRLAAYLARV